MKTLLGMFIVSVFAFAQGTVWLSWQQALRLSEKSGKPIMIDAMKDGCKYCVRMEKEVFADQAFAEYLHSKVIPVKINLSKEKMPIDEEAMMTPTFYFVAPGQKLLKKVPGSWNREDFKSILEELP